MTHIHVLNVLNRRLSSLEGATLEVRPEKLPDYQKVKRMLGKGRAKTFL